MNHLAWICLVGIGLSACTNEGQKPQNAQASVMTTPSTTTSTAMAGSTSAAPSSTAPAGPKLVVVDMTPSPDPTPMPSVKITSPKMNDSVAIEKAKDLAVKLDVKDWKTAKGDKHIHLILDDLPYVAIYDTSDSIPLSVLLGGREIKEGQHVLHAFASRPTHESVKSDKASAMVTFWVGKPGAATFDPAHPHVVYSRPKGANKGDMAKNLLIDFYLWPHNLDGGRHVRATLTGDTLPTPFMVDFATWAPKQVVGLPKGDYSVKLELLDSSGAVLPGPLTSITQKISVDPDAPMDMQMPSASHSTH